MIYDTKLTKNNKILIICGPTASGKTSLAVKCAKLLDTEIISADSMNVYKGLNIGTAKPTEIEKDGVIHHLIDVIEPNKPFSVGDYRELALPIVDNLLKNGKIPIICGGTGFYINSILYNLSYGNTCADLEVREKYLNLAKEFGNSYVYDFLLSVDPESASKIHENDIKRVVRAIEIYYSGKKKSEIVDELKPNYDYKAYSINFDRETLYNRINCRVDLMIENGLIEEVINLLNSGISKNNQCMQGIGYKEVVDYIENNISKDEMIEKIKLNTRHYAKRQITFFKKLNGLTLLEPLNIDTLAKRIVKDFYD